MVGEARAGGQKIAVCQDTNIHNSLFLYLAGQRFGRRARVGTGRLPAVTPRPTALLKQHGAELGHHACTAHSLAVHPRARHPSCPAGARGDDALVGLL